MGYKSSLPMVLRWRTSRAEAPLIYLPHFLCEEKKKCSKEWKLHYLSTTEADKHNEWIARRRAILRHKYCGTVSKQFLAVVYPSADTLESTQLKRHPHIVKIKLTFGSQAKRALLNGGTVNRSKYWYRGRKDELPVQQVIQAVTAKLMCLVIFWWRLRGILETTF